MSVSQRVRMFRKFAQMTLEESPSGPAAVDAIVGAFAADVEALEAHARGSAQSAAAAMAQRRTGDDMMTYMHHMLSAEITRNARLEAYSNQLRAIVDLTRAAVVKARVGEDDEHAAAVPCADLDAILDRPVDRPEFTPVVVAFVPSVQFTTGQFRADDGAVVAAYPFAGWSAVVRQGAAESRRLEPTFLVDDRALPESFMWDIYALKLNKLT